MAKTRKLEEWNAFILPMRQYASEQSFNDLEDKINVLKNKEHITPEDSIKWRIFEQELNIRRALIVLKVV